MSPRILLEGGKCCQFLIPHSLKINTTKSLLRLHHINEAQILIVVVNVHLSGEKRGPFTLCPLRVWVYKDHIDFYAFINKSKRASPPLTCNNVSYVFVQVKVSLNAIKLRVLFSALHLIDSCMDRQLFFKSKLRAQQLDFQSFTWLRDLMIWLLHW